MSETLAVKYRPTTFDDVVEQDAVKAILLNQLKTKETKNAYLFEGPAGCGKTTSARLFAKALNGGDDSSIIEIDAASNNSVDDVRKIREDAKYRSISSEYKVYILDECHLLSGSAYGALLKLLEEPPESTVFILCTTDAQKIPPTIISRVQTFRFTKISMRGIEQRLDDICDGEYGCYPFQKEAVEYIAKQAQGGMREAISLMGKVLDGVDPEYLRDDGIPASLVVSVLGTVDYDTMCDLAESLLKKAQDKLPPHAIIDKVYNDGKDLKLFLRDFLSFSMDLCIFHDMRSIHYTSLPPTAEWNARLETLLEGVGKGSVLNLMDTLLRVNNDVKWDPHPKTVISAELTLFREEVAQ